MMVFAIHGHESAVGAHVSLYPEPPLLQIVAMLISGSFQIGPYIFVLLAIGLFGGAIGGILGINLSARRKRY